MTTKTGTLWLCATPIGNLEDMTYRAVRILQEADLIAVEDTRNSIRLLNHFDIHTPMTSYHEYNKFDKGRTLVKKLLEGQTIALITDAGMPGISDPGEELVQMCREAGIPVTAAPGACACVMALSLSGQKTRRFCFEGFLPQDKRNVGRGSRSSQKRPGRSSSMKLRTDLRRLCRSFWKPWETGGCPSVKS